MKTGIKFQIKPTDEQAQKLRMWIGCQRNIYNAKVENMRYQLVLRKFHKDQFPDIETPFVEFNQEYACHTKDIEFFKEVPPPILRNGSYRFMQAVNRWQKKLSDRPTRKKKHGKQSVLVTSELFSIKGNTLFVGTKKRPVGAITINAHREFKHPKMISISVVANSWYVSFCNDDGTDAPSYDKLLDLFVQKDRDYLTENGVGIDPGVKINACLSNGERFVFSTSEQTRLKELKAKKKRYQRQMSRRLVKGQKKQSRNYGLAKASYAKANKQIANIRLDFNHKTSRKIADSEAQLIMVEKTKIKNMVKKAKPKQDDSGKYLPNGAAAKSGLNKAILNNGLGQLTRLIEYKAAQNHKLVLKVPAKHTSQKCNLCKHVHKGNRLSQAVFTCLSCGHVNNADDNASANMRDDGIDLLLTGFYHKELASKKRVKVKVGRNVAPVA